MIQTQRHKEGLTLHSTANSSLQFQTSSRGGSESDSTAEMFTAFSFNNPPVYVVLRVKVCIRGVASD